MQINIDKCTGIGCEVDVNKVNTFIDDIEVFTFGMYDNVQFDIKDRYPPTIQQWKEHSF